MSLRDEIVARYGSVYKFWKSHADELPSKGVVYQVAGGNYAGDQAGHERKMRAIMDGRKAPTENVDKIYEAIRNVACTRCPDRQSPGPRCAGCLELFRMQAQAVSDTLKR
ncbi:hypothetical protein [Desulfoplanes formicivorans]|uniref:Uncharacterized protein n=1 Tax=Desulfoplanes formicivorans TaxID=1592317 RepID=A0A194AH86_9BACT|nr:hypothetical protein [Desulfoplanes formicivorans]GAU08124.1 hypothetical protein DPF_0827 [Desulfoplanes formicivorans]